MLCPLFHDVVWNHTWKAGRRVPGVTLTVARGFDCPSTALKLCPNMNSAYGVVGLVVVVENAERIAHRALLREGEWVTIEPPTGGKEMRIEFMESCALLSHAQRRPSKHIHQLGRRNGTRPSD